MFSVPLHSQRIDLRLGYPSCKIARASADHFDSKDSSLCGIHALRFVESEAVIEPWTGRDWQESLEA